MDVGGGDGLVLLSSWELIDGGWDWNLRIRSVVIALYASSIR